MLEDARPPAPAPAAGLELIFQQLHEHDHQVALDGSLLADAQILDLLDQVADIEALQPALLEQSGLLLDPETEVALIEPAPGFLLRAGHGQGPPSAPLEHESRAQ